MNENMQQLEIPQISLARYFDLLRRRKWQVIPVSLLGLLIGGLVAFLIPRYYVAETRLQYYPTPEINQSRSPLADPFLHVVNAAVHTIRNEVFPTLRALGWDEATIRDPAAREDAVRAIREEITVTDLNPARDRDYAQIVVKYRDRDGPRSAEFLTALIETWKQRQLARLQAAADGAIQDANTRVKNTRNQYTDVSNKLAELELKYGFSRELGTVGQAELTRLRETELSVKAAELAAQREARAGLQAELDTLQRQLQVTPRLASVSMADVLKQLGGPETRMAQAYLERELLIRSLATSMGPAHPGRAAAERRVEQLELELQQFLEEQGGGLNPRLRELQQLISDKETALARVDFLIEDYSRQVAELRDERRRRSEAYGQYAALLQELAEAEMRREQAQANLDRQADEKARLERRELIQVIQRANVPEHPTDPNVFLVAGLGCIIGLGLAIGLILLLDTVQGSIKTVDDAERTLPVPVLGGVSYIETEEQRLRTTAGRRRTAVTAAALLFCGVVVVTVYYVAPERLPPFARDLLTMVLGN